ncbi:cyclic nucleotide-binding domain-containing protein [Vibrio variabilis]|uniref:cyclic nucleotide-binding domain-containing protein n=1 Tax=Vibrio variabilis TaxID=990271 RepID=UPI000DDA7A4D
MWFYRVESGFIGLYQVAETGKESLLRLYGKGSYFGYRSLFTCQRYPATARAMEDSVVSRVNVHSFEDLQHLSPSLTKASQPRYVKSWAKRATSRSI